MKISHSFSNRLVKITIKVGVLLGALEQCIHFFSVQSKDGVSLHFLRVRQQPVLEGEGLGSNVDSSDPVDLFEIVL